MVQKRYPVNTRSLGQYRGGGGQGGLNLPLPVPFNPGSRPVFFGSRPFAIFRLRNIAQRCVIFPFFSLFPPPWESRFSPPLLPPPVHLPPPFLPVSRPPVPPYNTGQPMSYQEFTNKYSCKTNFLHIIKLLALFRSIY